MCEWCSGKGQFMENKLLNGMMPRASVTEMAITPGWKRRDIKCNEENCIRTYFYSWANLSTQPFSLLSKKLLLLH